MAIQMSKRSQVSQGRLSICNRQIAAPAKGTQGTRGVLKGLCRSGRDLLKMIMLRQTMVNASNVPMDTSSLRI
jgi:hypothetical protein